MATSVAPMPSHMPISRALLFTLLALCCAGAGLRWRHTLHIEVRTPDERTYVDQAQRLRDDGIAGTRALVRRYLSDSTQRLYPPPTRIGHHAAVLAAMRLSGWTDARAGSLFSLVSSTAALAVVAVICAQLFAPTIAVAAVTAFAVFPPELAVAMRGWGDAPMGLIGVLLLALAWPLAQGRWHPARLGTFALVGLLGILLKESAPLMFGLCTLAVLWPVLRARDLRRSALLLGVTGAAVLGGIAVLAWGAGGFSEFAQVMVAWQRANAANDYALAMQTGPGYLLFVGFFTVAPMLSVMAALGIGALAFARRAEQRVALLGSEAAWRAAVGMTAVTAGFLAAPMVLAHWLNLRYVSVVFAPIAVLAGIGIAATVQVASDQFSLRPLQRRALLAVLLLLTAHVDYGGFYRDFVSPHQIPDLSNGFVMALRAMR